jgi:hypothetical protein
MSNHYSKSSQASFARLFASRSVLGGFVLMLLTSSLLWRNSELLTLRDLQPEATPCYPNGNGRKLLFGILLQPEETARRDLLRRAYDRWKPFLNNPQDRADFVFVLCRPASPEVQATLEEESTLHRDLWFVKGEENMNAGKTWRYLEVCSLHFLYLQRANFCTEHQSIAFKSRVRLRLQGWGSSETLQEANCCDSSTVMPTSICL